MLYLSAALWEPEKLGPALQAFGATTSTFGAASAPSFSAGAFGVRAVRACALLVQLGKPCELPSVRWRQSQPSVSPCWRLSLFCANIMQTYVEVALVVRTSWV